MAAPPPVSTAPILHVVVVGFHHIKGYQLEYAYPPLVEGGTPDSQELPEPWKHLPSLALPDGAHNYEEDTIYFHLPALDNPKQSIFGISCYRQINAEKLLRREADVTRSSVQKSVCVLSRLPLFGLIQAKLQLVTHAYFEERDFSKVSLLQETFQNLNSLLCPDMLQGSSTFLGLSSRDLILHFKHKAVLLFKLFLLERKVLFYKTPVKDLCSTILTLCSLFPGMMEGGLDESASTAGLRQLTSELRPEEHDFLEVSLGPGHSPSELKQSLDAVTTEKGRQEDTTAEPSPPPLESQEQRSPEYLSLLSRTIRNSETRSLAKRAESIETPTEDTGPPGHKTNVEEKPAEKPTVESVRLSLGSVGKEIFSKILPAGLADIAHLNRTSVDDAVFEQEDKLVSEIEELLDSDPKDKAEMKSKLEFVEREDSDVARSPISPSSCKGTPTAFGTAGFIWSKLPSAIYSLASKDSPLAGIGGSVVNTATVAFKGTVPGPEEGDPSAELDGVLTPEDGDSGLVTFNMVEGNGAAAVSKEQEDLLLQSIPKVLALTNEECGLPLPIFTKGSLCLPYVSLPIIDLLGDISVRSCVVGATNDLFKQKKHLFDVIVEVRPELHNIDIGAFENFKQNYTVAIFLAVGCSLVGVSRGSLCLVAREHVTLAGFEFLHEACLPDAEGSNGKDQEAFNTAFLSAWRATHNFKMWNSVTHPCIEEIPTGHFYRGQLSVADMKLRIAHSIQSSERGRKINQAVVSTGRVVAQTTGKVVGGALTSAKSVVSSLWSHFSPPTPSSSVDSVPSAASKETLKE
ncbi:unnamed protein product [Ixodes hexagonus]